MFIVGEVACLGLCLWVVCDVLYCVSMWSLPRGCRAGVSAAWDGYERTDGGRYLVVGVNVVL